MPLPATFHLRVLATCLLLAHGNMFSDEKDYKISGGEHRKSFDSSFQQFPLNQPSSNESTSNWHASATSMAEIFHHRENSPRIDDSGLVQPAHEELPAWISKLRGEETVQHLFGAVQDQPFSSSVTYKEEQTGGSTQPVTGSRMETYLSLGRILDSDIVPQAGLSEPSESEDARHRSMGISFVQSQALTLSDSSNSASGLRNELHGMKMQERDKSSSGPQEDEPVLKRQIYSGIQSSHYGITTTDDLRRRIMREDVSQHARQLSKYYSYKAGPVGELPTQFGGPLPSCSTTHDCPSPIHSCLNGKCTCPPILRGNANCTVQTPVQRGRANCFAGLMSDRVSKVVFARARANNTMLRFLLDGMLGDQGERDLNRRRNWSRCAVVGSSGILTAKKQGEIIDSHSAVIRFNNAPTKNYAKVAGQRTTLRVQNFDYCGAGETDDEICINYTLRKQCTPSKNQPSRSLPITCEGDNLITVSKPFSIYVHSYWELNQPKGMRDPACQWICPKRLRGTGGSVGPTLRIPKDKDLLAAMRECKRKCVKKTSAGFFGILFASHLCGEVDVYGFPTSTTRPSGYYFRKAVMTNKRGRNPPMFRHHWKFERFCMDFLEKAGIPGLKFH